MGDAMTPATKVQIDNVSGVAYTVAANGENRGASANALNFTVPAAATATDEDVMRPRLRLVRD